MLQQPAPILPGCLKLDEHFTLESLVNWDSSDAERASRRCDITRFLRNGARVLVCDLDVGEEHARIALLKRLVEDARRVVADHPREARPRPPQPGAARSHRPPP